MCIMILSIKGGKLLFDHQTKAIKKANNLGGMFLIWDVGCGKTRTAIEIFKNLKSQVELAKLLVVCPISLIDSGWIAEATFNNLTVCNLRKEVIDADVYVINYEALLTKKVFLIDSLIEEHPFMCVVDESSRMKNFKAKTVKVLLELRKRFIKKLCLSATPCPNDETELWAQVKFLDDRIVHDNFYAFRNKYFHLARGGQTMKGNIFNKNTMREFLAKGFKYEITPAKRARLMASIAPICDYIKKDDVLDLPEEICQYRYVNLTDDLMKLYKQMKNELVLEFKDKMFASPNALTKINKLRQITSGFIMDNGVVTTLDANSKLNELKYILDEIGNKQVIIWCEYKEEIRKILEMYPASVTLYSDTDDRESSINKFMSKEAQYLIAHPRSAGHGLNFQQCSYEVFYSLSFSWEMYEQCKGRVHRSGQKNNCTYIHLLAKGTIDEAILKVLQHKGTENDILMAMVS